jgi:hypothetical protein
MTKKIVSLICILIIPLICNAQNEKQYLENYAKDLSMLANDPSDTERFQKIIVDFQYYKKSNRYKDSTKHEALQKLIHNSIEKEWKKITLHQTKHSIGDSLGTIIMKAIYEQNWRDFNAIMSYIMALSYWLESGKNPFRTTAKNLYESLYKSLKGKLDCIETQSNQTSTEKSFTDLNSLLRKIQFEPTLIENLNKKNTYAEIEIQKLREEFEELSSQPKNTQKINWGPLPAMILIFFAFVVSSYFISKHHKLIKELTPKNKNEIEGSSSSIGLVGFDKKIKELKKDIGQINADIKKVSHPEGKQEGSKDEQIEKLKREILEKVSQEIKDNLSQMHKDRNKDKNSSESNLTRQNVNPETIINSATTKLLDMERKSVESIRQEFQEYHSKQICVLEKTAQPNREFLDMCYKLKESLTLYPDLDLSFRNILKQPQGYDTRVNKLLSYLKETITRTAQNDAAKELMLLRKKQNFLLSHSEVEVLEELLKYDPEAWIRGKFLDFSDLLLKEYQKLEFDGGKENRLKEAIRTHDEILQKFGLAVIPITLGRTYFDPQLHVGRSSAHDNRMPNETIAAVIKNGFRQLDGVVLQQPEVIVNRI